NKFLFFYVFLNYMVYQKESSARKLIDTSFVWRKEDSYYAAIDIMSRVDSAVLTLVSYNLFKNYPEISLSELKKYIELRKLPNPEGLSLVDERRSCYENVESVVYVRALTKKRWEAKEYNRVKIKNLVKNKVPFQEKVKSIRSLEVNCGCNRTDYVSICRPAKYQRKIFRDERTYKDIPGSFINSVFCKHACIALDWLHLSYQTSSFDYFGPSSHVVKVSKIIIEDILKYKPKYPDYRLNQLFLTELKRRRINLHEPLLKYIFDIKFLHNG
ncbi:MAG: hypothetical protein QW412_02560, partial [Candidatus Aenigmatarchaeota archaeon]